MLLFALMSTIAAPLVVQDIPHLPIKLGAAVLIGCSLSFLFWRAGSRHAARLALTAAPALEPVA